MKKKENNVTHGLISISEMFCKYHPFTFIEPRFTDERVFWECPECEREFYNERKIPEFEVKRSTNEQDRSRVYNC